MTVIRTGEMIAAEDAPPAPALVAVPYLFARRFGVVLDMSGGAPVVTLREGADPKVLLEIRRVLGAPFAVETIVPEAFDRLLGDRYAMDGQATALAAGSLGIGELDLGARPRCAGPPAPGRPPTICSIRPTTRPRSG